MPKSIQNLLSGLRKGPWRFFLPQKLFLLDGSLFLTRDLFTNRTDTHILYIYRFFCRYTVPPYTTCTDAMYFCVHNSYKGDTQTHTYIAISVSLAQPILQDLPNLGWFPILSKISISAEASLLLHSLICLCVWEKIN